MRIVKLDENTKSQALAKLIGRAASGYGDYEKTVQSIIADVRDSGDGAVIAYEKKFDRCDLTSETLRVSEQEIAEAYKALDPGLVDVMKKAAENIRVYHEKQKRSSWITTREDGVILGQKVTPIEVSGCYVPGGRAVYPSSVLMNIVPAKVAGVEKIIMCTPPGPDGKAAAGTVVAADIAGADEIYKVGGAQAIAAMAYGTETIPKVDKITGPGNIFVALAKKACFGVTGIDSVAGPSEILIIADHTANPRYVAADLLSQAEHDPMASAILLTTDENVAAAVSEEIDGFLKTLSRARYSSAAILRSLLATTSRGPTTSCLQTARRDSSHLLEWTISSRRAVSFLTQRMLFGLFIKILNFLLSAKGSRRTPNPSLSVSKRRSDHGQEKSMCQQENRRDGHLHEVLRRWQRKVGYFNRDRILRPYDGRLYKARPV